MTLRQIKEYIKGWLPKAPRQPETAGESRIATNPQADSRLRTSGNLFSYFGIILILLVTYRFVFQVFSPAVSVPSIQLVFAAGFVLLATGMAFRARSIESNVQNFRSPILMVGLALLTVSVFGIAFNTMLGLDGVTITLPKYRAILAAGVAFSFVGLAGLLLLLKGRATRSSSVSFPKKSFSILAVGTAINLVVAPIQAWFVSRGPPHSSAGGFLPLVVVALIVSALLMPLGTVFSTYGWAAIFSDGTKKHLPILLAVLAVFATIILVSLLL